MPRGDRTGPMGQGPITGKALGYCEGSDSPGFTKGAGGAMGRGFGSGRGMGMGRRMGFSKARNFGGAFAGSFPGYHRMHPMSNENEVIMLKYQADMLSCSQKDIEKRLAELEKGKE